MKDFNPFRISFDRPLRARERTRARVTATIIGGVAVFLGLSSVGMLLNASSEAIGKWTNAAPPEEARILATHGEDPKGKPCEEQTWPYLEARCLKSVDDETSRRSTPKHGLASQQIPLPAAPAPAPNAAQPPRSAALKPDTTGTAAADGPSESIAAGATDEVAVPLPIPAPTALTASAGTGSLREVSKPDDATKRTEANPASTRRQQRRLLRQERKRAQRQRRQEARALRRERLRARQEARDEDMFFIFR